MKPLPDFTNVANIDPSQPDWLEAMTINGHFIWPRPTTNVSSFFQGYRQGCIKTSRVSEYSTAGTNS